MMGSQLAPTVFVGSLQLIVKMKVLGVNAVFGFDSQIQVRILSLLASTNSQWAIDALASPFMTVWCRVIGM